MMLSGETRLVGLCTVVTLATAALVAAAESKESPGENRRRLILISMDGFRWDYLNGRAQTPTFNSLKKKGVHAREGIQNVFITNTLPNHYSMVTGLYVESHGIMDNTIVDSQFDQPYTPVFYDHDAVNDPDWLKSVGEPIWVSHRLQNQGRSGLLMWFGGETAIRGVRPEKFILHSYDMDEMTEMNHLIEWMTDTNNPIELAIVYFPNPDYVAHLHGPESRQVTDAVEKLDGALNHLLQSLDKNGLSDKTDIIVTSDHGFTSTPPEKSIQIDDILDPSWYKSTSFLPGSVLSIFPMQGKHDIVYAKMKKASGLTDLFQVFKAEDIPERFHYKGHKRVPPIFAMAKLGYSFVNKERLSMFDTLKGNHGYDNKHREMRPFFTAMGPSFKEDFSVDTFENVDIYPLMCHILGIKPAPNNGSMATVSKMLRHYPSSQSEQASTVHPWLPMCACALLVVGIVVSVWRVKDGQTNKRD